MAAMLARTISEEELVLALSAVVTRDGSLEDLAVLNNDDRREVHQHPRRDFARPPRAGAIRRLAGRRQSRLAARPHDRQGQDAEDI